MIDEVAPTFGPRIRLGLWHVVAGAESVGRSDCGSCDSLLCSPMCVAGVVFSFRLLREASSRVSPSTSRNVFLTTTLVPKEAGSVDAVADVNAPELVVLVSEAT